MEIEDKKDELKTCASEKNEIKRNMLTINSYE